MDDPRELNVKSTAAVIFLLILSVLGILWTVSCSWLTGRKKRQRVAHNADVEGLVLQITSPKGSAKGRIQDRYTSADQIVILPVDDMGHSLDAPMIVVTPPSPQDTPAENTSLRSESSIGTAEDLIPNSVETEASAAEGDIDRENRVRDSMRNVLPSVCPPESEDNSGLKKVQFTSRTDSQVNDFVSEKEDELFTVNDGNSVAGQTLSQTHVS